MNYGRIQLIKISDVQVLIPVLRLLPFSYTSSFHKLFHLICVILNLLVDILQTGLNLRTHFSNQKIFIFEMHSGQKIFRFLVGLSISQQVMFLKGLLLVTPSNVGIQFILNISTLLKHISKVTIWSLLTSIARFLL